MNKLTMVVSVLALAAGCGRDSSSMQSAPSSNDSFATVRTAAEPAMAPGAGSSAGFDESGGNGQAMALDEGKMGKKDSPSEQGQYKMQNARAEDAIGTGRYGTIGHGSGTGAGYGVGGGSGTRRPAPKTALKGMISADDALEGAESVRSWFPETFLFEPLIVTDPQGNATVPVRVPDRLTNWRILALAHSRQGAQGGTTTSFLGTLPTYLDLVVPKYLLVGDKVKLPIQIVNTTATASTSKLAVGAKNGELAYGGGNVTAPANGGTVEYATLTANRAGKLEVAASLAGTDAVRRTIDVRPLGRPEVVSRTGTLAEPRTVTLVGPEGSDPTTDRVRLLVYPGALALLRSELGVSTNRTSLADTAYALLLAGRADAMLSALGDKADPEVVRNLSILVGQRAIRSARTLDVWSATLLAEPALAHPNNPILSRLGERAAAWLAQHQRPDGTFAGETGWTLQRVLVATANATRAVQASHTTTPERQRAQGVAMKASAAFARTSAQVTDAYTAAAILASGAVTGPLAETFRDRVRTGIKADPDGNKYLEVADNVVDANGLPPSRSEATALAVLALAGDPKAPIADLGSTLLGAYNPDVGWGSGTANLVCMRAVIELFKTPVPEGVKITLTMDGQPVTSGTLDRAALREVLALEAPAPSGFAGAHEWKLVAEPAVPGLGYSLALHGWVPWKKQAVQQGLEMNIEPAIVAGDIGKPIEITVTAIAPSNNSLEIKLQLPAGVQVDEPSVEALKAASTIDSFEIAEGKLTMRPKRLQQGQTFAAKLKVIPTLAGTLHTAASSISTGRATYYVPPATWTVR